MPAAVECKTYDLGTHALRGPERCASPRSHLWLVTLVDRTLETAEEKTFASATMAQAFIDTLVNGHPPVDPLAEVALGPRAKTIHEPGVGAPAPPQLNHRHKRPGGAFNLRAVRDVLEDYGLDPFAEIAEALQARRPVLHRGGEKAGQPVVDPLTGEPLTEPVISGGERAKILVELGQYVAPKLKAIEMKVEDKTKLTEAEVDKRIADMLDQRAAQQAQEPAA